MFGKILTVCTGNICRSPVAEYVFRDALQAAGRRGDVASAGIGALVGHPPDDAASRFMVALNVSMDAHRARQIDRTHTKWADLILVMEQHHLDYVLRMDPTARGKAFLLGHWQKREIPDPYRRGDDSHRRAYEAIREEVERWLQRM